jgi:hypothetical protein
MPAESDWVLHSCYADKSCLRNVLAYALGRELGRWAPRTRFVELFVDGKLQGLYVAIEKIKRDRGRIVLPRAGADAAGDLSGGYIVKAEAGGEGMPGETPARDWVSSVEPRVWSYHEPRFDEITAAQRQYIRDHLTKFETLARSARFTDGKDGYAAWIDVASWVDFALVQELTANVDAYFKSVYLVKQPDGAGGKLVAGPIWDFDLAFGNVTFREGNRHDIWAHGANRFMPWSKSPYTPPSFVSRVPTYWEKLWAERPFQGLVRCRWQELRKGAFATGAVHARIDGWGTKLAAAQARDQALWKSLALDVNSNAYLPATYAAELKYLKDWIDRRTRWIDANLPGSCPS